MLLTALTLFSLLLVVGSLWGLHYSMSRLDWRNDPLGVELQQLSGRQQAMHRQLNTYKSNLIPRIVLIDQLESYQKTLSSLMIAVEKSSISLQQKPIIQLQKNLHGLMTGPDNLQINRDQLRSYLLEASRQLSRIRLALEQRQILQIERRLDEARRWETLLFADFLWILLFGSILVYHLRKQEQTNLSRALKDGLTGLANRTCFRQRLEEQVQQASRYHGGVAVHLLDLNGFKDINDSLGHSHGDRLLQAVADRFRRELRKSDLIARIGGDEFAVIQPMLDNEVSAEALARRLCACLNKPIQLGDESCRISVSCGISLFPENGQSVEQLMTQSDLAMYQAKAAGNDHPFQFFQDKLNQQLERKRDLIRDLFDAVEEDKLQLAYQPQLNMKTGELVAIECLLRWKHPRYGEIEPEELLDLAERYALLEKLEEWVIQEALQTARRWPEHWLLCINLHRLSSERLQRIERQLEMTGLKQQKIMLEMKESLARKAERLEPGILAMCRNKGFELVLDDFGPGGSSLNFLVSKPWSRVKLDCRFLQELEDFSRGKQLLCSLNQMMRGLGVELLIEGLETEQEFQLVNQSGCHVAQGHYLASPTSIDLLIAQLPALSKKFNTGQTQNN